MNEALRRKRLIWARVSKGLDHLSMCMSGVPISFAMMFHTFQGRLICYAVTLSFFITMVLSNIMWTRCPLRIANAMLTDRPSLCEHDRLFSYVRDRWGRESVPFIAMGQAILMFCIFQALFTTLIVRFVHR